MQTLILAASWLQDTPLFYFPELFVMRQLFRKASIYSILSTDWHMPATAPWLRFLSVWHVRCLLWPSINLHLMTWCPRRGLFVLHLVSFAVYNCTQYSTGSLSWDENADHPKAAVADRWTPYDRAVVPKIFDMWLGLQLERIEKFLVNFQWKLSSGIWGFFSTISI